MSPELIGAIKERLELDYTHAEIEGELVATGYDPMVAKQAILAAEQALHEPSAPIPAPDAGVATATTSQIPVAQGTQLPGVSDLYMVGWGQLRDRYDLAFILAAPYLVLAIIEYVVEIGPGAASAVGLGLVSVVSIGALAAYAFVFAIALRSVMTGVQTPFRFGDAVAWAKSHYLAVVGLMLTVFFVITGGLLLLLIPGFIIMGYVYLAQYVLVAEDKRGLAAVLRSRELIYGQWWEVVLRLLGVAILFFVTLFLLTLVVIIGAMVTTSYDPDVVSPLRTLFDELFSSLVSGAVTLFFLGVGRTVYESLRSRTHPAAVPSARGQYRIVFWVGVVLSVLFLFLILVAAERETSSTEGLDNAGVPILDEAIQAESRVSNPASATDAKERANALREQGGIEERND